MPKYTVNKQLSHICPVVSAKTTKFIFVISQAMMYYYQLLSFYLTYFFSIETYFWKFYVMKFVWQLHKKEYISFHFIVQSRPILMG